MRGGEGHDQGGRVVDWQHGAYVSEVGILMVVKPVHVVWTLVHDYLRSIALRCRVLPSSFADRLKIPNPFDALICL